MSQLLALLSAALYGIADFSGGVATRKIVAWRVTAWSQLFGVPLLVLGVLIVTATSVTRGDLIYGAIGGLFGLIGVAALYSALAAGTMSIVSPITGSVAALIPVMWGLATGESVSTTQWIGISLAIVAVIMIAFDRSGTHITRAILAQSLIAAVGFAAFFIALSQTSEASGLWPLVAARSVSIPIAFVVAISIRSSAFPPRVAVPTVAIAGVADMAANLAILLALQIGPLGISSVLTSLYPAFTVLAAVFILKERPNAIQWTGVALALTAAVILAA